MSTTQISLSSSPGLPSLDELFAKGPNKPPITSANHAPPIPADVRNTFTSAANLLREAPEIDIETEQITFSPPRKSNSSKCRKNKNATPEVVSVPTETPILIESSPGEKPWQKFKSKKPVSLDRQTSVSKGRVEKPLAKGKSKQKPETVSRHFAAENAANDKEGNIDNSVTTYKPEDQTINELYCSEPALRRRSDWTPPPIDSPMLGSESDSKELPSPIGREMGSRDVFQSLQDQYGHKATQSTSASDNSQRGGIIKKRKKIELVSTSNEIGQHPREPSPPKALVTKKKTARTITELATAPYMVHIQLDLDLTGPATKESLLNYFDEDGAVKALVEHQTAVMSQKKEKVKESKAPAKPKRKKKSGTANNPILLSPSSALKQSSNQDFLFGTSSQLVAEESPTTLRNLQLAIQASNQIHSDPFAESDSQGLWHAGARDTDGELMRIDDVELVEDSPSLPRLQGHPIHSREEFADIDEILKSPGIDASTRKESQLDLNSQSQAISSTELPPPSNQEQVMPQPTAETSNPRPNFESFTDAQLSKQIASYGFKPVKKRQAMIALLDQCWSSQNPGSSISQSRPISTTAAAPAPKKRQKKTAEPEPASENPPKRRGRPRKTSTTEASTAIIAQEPKPPSPKKPRGRPKKEAPKAVEIADSDEDESASSRSSSPDRDRIFSSPPAVDLSLADNADMSLAMSPTDQQTELFKHITRAVTSAPRSTDPANPSWHEKMLLYDPIVLEDLAAWLNAGALGGVGYDGEVSPVDVKSWCESKSVICLWRQNLRGKERKRY
ncbi:hypothetical protein F5B19DRAFT_490743 [Rostrohypoxylon terebratum]|nr:hypothetical protein F5B19DRAFT_490743 [Rostrohypoxylon terebratum]